MSLTARLLARRAPLSAADTTRLARYKWLYWLQAQGFSRNEAQHLWFYRGWFRDSADRNAQVGR